VVQIIYCCIYYTNVIYVDIQYPVNPNVEYHPLVVVYDFLFNTSAATLHFNGPSSGLSDWGNSILYPLSEGGESPLGGCP
jgi:hypothetical protein